MSASPRRLRRPATLLAAACLVLTVPAGAWSPPPTDLGAQPYVLEVPVHGGEELEIATWVRTAPEVRTTLVGARWDGGEQVARFPVEDPGVPVRRTMTVEVPEQVTSLEVVVGQVSADEDALLRVDDVELGGPALADGDRVVTTEYRGNCGCSG